MEKLRVEDTDASTIPKTISAMAPVGDTRAVATGGAVTRRIDVYGVTPEFL